MALAQDTPVVLLDEPKAVGNISFLVIICNNSNKVYRFLLHCVRS